MSGISDVGGSGQIPQQPPEKSQTDLNPLEAIHLFNDLIQQLTSLASEVKLGGKGHG